MNLLIAGMVCAFAALTPSLTSQESKIVEACKQRVQELNADANTPTFAFTYLCDKRLAVVYPQGHDLKLFLPTLGGAATKTIALEDAFQPVFNWLDSDYMQPTSAQPVEAAAKKEEVIAPELVLLIVDHLEHREHFNIRYTDGVLLDDMVMHYLKPLEHEDCIGVPCAHPGSCGGTTTCAWEIHVPLCELVNRGAAELMERKYGDLPPALLGMAEIVEVGVTGGHYAYRHWGDQRTLLPHSERDGYMDEFGDILKQRYAKKKQRRPYLVDLLQWQGGHFSPEKYAASWGLGQTLLAHLKTSGKGKNQRTLGDLLQEVGELEDASAEQMLEVILEFDPKFESTFRKKISSKYRKDLSRLLFD